MSSWVSRTPLQSYCKTRCYKLISYQFILQQQSFPAIKIYLESTLTLQVSNVLVLGLQGISWLSLVHIWSQTIALDRQRSSAIIIMWTALRSCAIVCDRVRSYVNKVLRSSDWNVSHNAMFSQRAELQAAWYHDNQLFMNFYTCGCFDKKEGEIDTQGSKLTFQLTSPVASVNVLCWHFHWPKWLMKHKPY